MVPRFGPEIKGWLHLKKWGKTMLEGFKGPMECPVSGILVGEEKILTTMSKSWNGHQLILLHHLAEHQR